MTRSSADLIADALFTEQGLARGDITAAHLQGCYDNLVAQATAADFDAIAGLLPAQPRAAIGTPPVSGVIVETRAHPALPKVIDSIIERCDIPVQLCHGRGNLPFIQSTSIASHIDSGALALTALDTDELNARQYNALLMSAGFWNQLAGRDKILIFQSDSLCCHHADYTLADFLDFDYIGSRWSRSRPVGLTVDGGSGGFSLRDWQLSVECLRRFAPHHWPGGEDGYFAFHMALMGANVANPDQMGQFSTQEEFTHRSFAAHAIRCLKAEQRAAFFAYCPEAAEVFPGVYHSIAQQS